MEAGDKLGRSRLGIDYEKCFQIWLIRLGCVFKSPFEIDPIPLSAFSYPEQQDCIVKEGQKQNVLSKFNIGFRRA